jgi:hypothetical protein
MNLSVNNDLVVRADERLAHAYELRVPEQISRLRRESARRYRRSVLRGLIGLGLAACICVGAFASQSSNPPRLIISGWVPQLASASSLFEEKTDPSVQSSPPAVHVAGADAQPAFPAQTTPQNAAPTAPSTSAELAQLLQTMTRDLANVQQGIEQVKTSQEQMIRDNSDVVEQLKAAQAQRARDNAKTVEQLKTVQEQMARVVVRSSEQNARPKTLPVPARPVATSTRKQAPTLLPPQARAQPVAPLELRPGEQ